MLTLIKRFWDNIANSGIKNAPTPIRQLSYFVNTYSVLAFFSLGIFGVLHAIEGSTILGLLELACAQVVICNMLALRVTHNVPLARFGLLSTIFVGLIVIFFTGGTHGTGIFWFFVFPVGAFFLAGSQKGILWAAALHLMLIIFMVLKEVGLIYTPYSFTTLRQLVISLAVVTIGVAVYQGIRERYEREVLEIDRAKSQFLTLASHQLRTPISAIGWFTEMLLSGDAGKLTDEQREYIQRAYDSNRRLAGMVDVMLLVSRLELKELYIRPESVDLKELCHKALQEQRQKEASHKKLHIKEEYEPHLPNLQLDKHIMNIILQNIFSNAVKYTPDGGTIAVRINTSSEVLNPQSAGSVMIEIQDTGYGIPKAQQHKIFDKLFRADNIKIKDTDGTGLGLYSVRAILDQTGGRVWFESEQDKGSTFFVLLPLEGMRKQRPKDSKGGHRA